MKSRIVCQRAAVFVVKQNISRRFQLLGTIFPYRVEKPFYVRHSGKLHSCRTLIVFQVTGCLFFFFIKAAKLFPVCYFLPAKFRPAFYIFAQIQVKGKKLNKQRRLVRSSKTGKIQQYLITVASCRHIHKIPICSIIFCKCFKHLKWRSKFPYQDRKRVRKLIGIIT